MAQTKDHSVVQNMVDAGYLKAEDLRTAEERSRLFAALGQEENFEPTDRADVVRPGRGDVFLLCTDGFWEYIDEDAMERALGDAASGEEWLRSMERRSSSAAARRRTTIRRWRSGAASRRSAATTAPRGQAGRRRSISAVRRRQRIHAVRDSCDTLAALTRSRLALGRISAQNRVVSATWPEGSARPIAHFPIKA